MADYHHVLDEKYYRQGNEIRINEHEILEWLKRDDVFIVIAKNDKEMVGYILVEIEKARPTLAKSMNEIGKIKGAFVVQAYRNKNLLKGMLQEAIDWLHAKEITRIELSAHSNNIVGKKVWEELGFTTFALKMTTDIQALEKRIKK